MLISGAAATRALAIQSIHICTYTYLCFVSNLGGCGHPDAGKSLHILTRIHAAYTHVSTLCMLISRAAAARALASPGIYIYIHMTYTHCVYANLGGCGYSCAGHYKCHLHILMFWYANLESLSFLHWCRVCLFFVRNYKRLLSFMQTHIHIYCYTCMHTHMCVYVARFRLCCQCQSLGSWTTRALAIINTYS